MLSPNGEALDVNLLPRIAPITPATASRNPDRISTWPFLRNINPATPPIMQSTKRLVPISSVNGMSNKNC